MTQPSHDAAQQSSGGATTRRPLLVYDGDCAFCAWSVRYAERVTGPAVQYAPFQEVAAEFPSIPPEEFGRAIRFADEEGHVTRAAEAAFTALARAPGRGRWLWAYRHVPGFARLTEGVYRLVARHRPAAFRLARLLYGPELVPGDVRVVSEVFLRLFALIYLVAFVSFGSQALGLVGADGILPVTHLVDALRARGDPALYWYVPFVFWLDASDAAIYAVVGIGVAASLALFFRVLPRFALVVAYLAYLSLYYAGQQFMSFQWDALLLECGFLAIFLPWYPRLVVWLYRWLLFRFMFMSGAVKLLSGDPAWATLTALQHHYETQPLPTMLAWYAHHLPDWLHTLSAVGTFAIELGLAFLIFAPRRLRFMAAWSFILLEVLIALTGNYNFFNLLTILLCLLLFDDAALSRLRGQPAVVTPGGRPGPVARIALRSLAVIVLAISATQLWLQLSGTRPAPAVARVLRAVSPLQAVNTYGLFAVMTTTRPEIVIEGSSDGRTWQAYEFRYKPGALSRTPGWVVPHQPRLDWQMWFAALSDYPRTPWVRNFLGRLLQNSPPVVALLGHNPFPETPPVFVRARLYEYRFADPATRDANAQWWTREPKGLYAPAMRLQITGGLD